MNVPDLLLADFSDAVEDEACRDAVGNAVAEGHENASEERGNRLVKVIPLDFLESGHHHDTDHYQGGSGSGKRNGADKGRQERADCKAQGHDHAGKALSLIHISAWRKQENSTVRI